jgi:hypothetical protein
MPPSIGRNIGNVVVMPTDYRMPGERRYLEDVILIKNVDVERSESRISDL